MLQLATCFVIWRIIGAEGVNNPRSVHVALETALTFNNNDSSANVKFIDDFQNFLSNIRKNVIYKDKDSLNRRNLKTPSRKSYRNYDSEHKKIKAPIHISNLKFTDFIKELIDILRTYQNEDLEDVMAVVDDEIRKYHYKGCKFYELVSNDNVRSLVAAKLGSIREKPAKDIKKKLVKAMQIIEDAKFNPRSSELLDYINSLYTKRDVDKFQKTLKYFNMYRSKTKRANMDLIVLVRDTIRNVIFDHYTNLNVNTRRDFNVKLQTYFWSNARENDSVQHLEWNMQYTEATKTNRDLRENTGKPIVSKEKENSNVKVKDFTPSNKPDKPNNTLNLDLKVENRMDIYKSGGLIINKKKNKPSISAESENISEHKNNKSEGLELDIENSKHVESGSREESATASDERDISGKGYPMGYTANRDEEDDSAHTADTSSNEDDLSIKSKRHKKFTTPVYMDDSAEIVRHKKSKGYTNGNIGRSGKIHRHKIETYSGELASKPKKKNYKTKTTLYNKNRINTLWEESRTTKNHHDWWDDEAENIQSDNNRDDVVEYVKATQMPSDFRSRIDDEKKKPQDLKQIKSKHRSKVTSDVSSKETIELKTGFNVNDKIKKTNMEKDFSLNAYIENVIEDKGQGIKFKLAPLKKPRNDKQAFRTENKTDDNNLEKSKDSLTTGEHKSKESVYATSKLSKESMEEDVLTAFTRLHKTLKDSTKKLKHRSKQHTSVEIAIEEETNNKSLKKEKNTTTDLTEKEIKAKVPSHSTQEESIQEDVSTEFTKRQKTSDKSNEKLIPRSKQNKTVDNSAEEEIYTISFEEETMTTTKLRKKIKKPHFSAEESLEIATEEETNNKSLNKDKTITTDLTETDKKDKVPSHTTQEETTQEENISNEFVKQQNTLEKSSKETIIRSKQQNIIESPTKEDVKISLKEESITTTKIPIKTKKSFKIRQYTVLEKQISGEKSTEKENVDFTETDIKKSRRPKMAESSEKPISNSAEKSIEEKNYGSYELTTKTTKKDKKNQKNTKSTTPKHTDETETMEISMEGIKKSDQEKKTENKLEKPDKSLKHNAYKTQENSVDRSSEEEYSKYTEKETINEELSGNKESLRNKKSSHSHKKSKQSGTDIFISVEHIKHRPIKKQVKKFKTTVTTENMATKSITTPLYKEKTYDKDIKKDDSKVDTFRMHSKSEETQEKVDDSALLMSKPTPMLLVPETSTEASVLTETTINHTETTRKPYKPMDIPVKADGTGVISNKLFSRTSHESKTKSSDSKFFKSSDIKRSFRRMNSEDNTNKTTRYYLQLIDILQNYTTMTLNLDYMTPPPTVDIEGVNQTYFKYPLSDFQRRPNNKVKMKAADFKDITVISSNTINHEPTTKTYATTNKVTTNNYVTTNNIVTTTEITKKYDDEKPQKKRRTKKKRRRTITTIAITTSTSPTTTTPKITTTVSRTTATVPTTNIYTTNATVPTTTIYTTTANIPTTTATVSTTITIPTTIMVATTTNIPTTTNIATRTQSITGEIIPSKNRRLNDELDITNNKNKQTKAVTEKKDVALELDDNKLDDYYNNEDITNNTVDYETSNTTISEVGADLKEFLEKYNIKEVSNNETVDVLKDLHPDIGKDDVKKTKPSLNAEMNAEKARIMLDKDMMKMYGKTFSHITELTTPWNTMYTDPFEGNENLLGMDLLNV